MNLFFEILISEPKENVSNEVCVTQDCVETGKHKF